MKKFIITFVIFALVVKVEVLAQGSPELQGVINLRIEELTQVLQEPNIQSVVQSSNIEVEKFDDSKIKDLDNQWKNAKDDMLPLILSSMNNSCASALKKLQRDAPVYREIFITGIKGLNSCQTNKTSDYYQADEDWWKKAYHNGQGFRYFSEIEFDESASSRAISVYLPVLDHKKNVIGIAKAVLDVSLLALDL
jgi:hypothetical protein